MDLFDDVVESDGNLRALYRARIDGVAGKDFLIQPGGEDAASVAAAEALEQSITADELDFVEFMEHQLDAAFKGFSASEIDWQLRDALIVPARFIDVQHRRFVTGNDGELRLLVEGNSSGVALDPGRWVISRRKHANLARAGLFRTAVWWALFKRFAMRDWLVFSEKYGIPHAVGVYDEAETSEDAKAALKQGLEELGEAGQTIIEKTTQIIFADGVAQREGDVSAIHPAIIDHCDGEIAKLIAGGVLTSDTGGPGSFALGKVHEGSFFALKVADAVRFARTFLRDVSIPFTRFNGFAEAGAKAPRLKLKVIPELDPKTKAEVAAILVKELGADIDVEQLRDELGYRGGSGGEQSQPRPSEDDPDPDDALSFDITWEPDA